MPSSSDRLARTCLAWQNRASLCLLFQHIAAAKSANVSNNDEISPVSPTATGSLCMNKEQWYLVLVLCLVLTLFNVMGTRQALLTTSDATTAHDNDDGSTTIHTPTFLPLLLLRNTTAASLTTSKIEVNWNSENHRLDPTLLQRQTQHSPYTQVWQEYGFLAPHGNKNGPLPLYYNRSAVPLASVCPGNSRQQRRASFHAKTAAYWETLPHPTLPNTTVSPRTGLQAAAVHSVSSRLHGSSPCSPPTSTLPIAGNNKLAF